MRTYLVKLAHAPTGAIAAVTLAACEADKHVDAYLAHGFQRCTPGAYRAAWRLRDALAFVRLRNADLLAWLALQDTPVERSVGGVVKEK